MDSPSFRLVKLLLVAAEAEITVGVFNPQEFLTGVLCVMDIMAG